MKKQDQTARLKNHSSVSFTSFCSFPLPVSVPVTSSSPPPALASLPPVSLSIYTLLSLTMLSLLISPERKRSRGICKSLLLRKLHPAQPAAEHVCVLLQWFTGYQHGGSLRESPESTRFTYCQQIVCSHKNNSISTSSYTRTCSSLVPLKLAKITKLMVIVKSKAPWKMLKLPFKFLLRTSLPTSSLL